MNIRKNIDLLFTANKRAINQIIRNRKLHVSASINYNNIYDEVHENAAPCFVLSTGRCGTHLLTKLLSKHKNIEVLHEPNPQLIYYSKYAFENYIDKSEELKRIVDAARYEYIRDCHILNLQYVETNNRITFFAYQLAELFPKAKFIHLVRNPIPFIKSGLNRNWYSGKNNHDEGRISLDSDEWRDYSNAQKIAWLWESTNNFIENFKEKVDDNRVITIRSEDLFSKPKEADLIFQFLNLEPITKQKINKIISKPTNVSRNKNTELKTQNLKDEVAELIHINKKYNYEI